MASTRRSAATSDSSSRYDHQDNLVRIPEATWRAEATRHSQRIRQLLGPGLTTPLHAINSGSKRAGRQQQQQQQDDTTTTTPWTALDPKHPTYNFLIEYYGLKGAKGPRRLARWSPDPRLQIISSTTTTLERPIVAHGILLEGAHFERDIGDTLHLRGAMPHEDGIVYSPAQFFGKQGQEDETTHSTSAAPYLWYRAVLEQTLKAEPVLHCHGLHEWAMQFQPEGAPDPPSGKYQAHLPLRVPRKVINQVVERKGVHCTHVDALRYFAPAAGPLNHHGANLERLDQLRLEQPACVHAHMDLIKIGLRLQPFISADLLADAVEIALRARNLDVAASPYDATGYGVGIVAVETPEGRAEYRDAQRKLMKDAAPVRREMLQAYESFLQLAFDEETINHAQDNPDPERYAKAKPGGLPWRKNLVSTKGAAATATTT